MSRILLITIALIVYGSLFPWSFHPAPAGPLAIFWHSWPKTIGLFELRDIVSNVVLYLPLGLFGSLMLAQQGKRWSSVAVPTALGMALSTTLEMAQLFDTSRFSSSFDVLCNTSGALAGAMLGALYTDALLPVAKRAERALSRPLSGAVLLLGCWLGYQTFPLFPDLARTVLRAKLATLAKLPQVSAPELIGVWIEWIMVGCLLEDVAPGKSSRGMILFLLGVLPTKLIVFARTVTGSEILGAIGACITWNVYLARCSRRAMVAGVLALGGLILLGLMPYRFQGPPAPFSWVPFRALFETPRDFGFLVFFKKCFWYGGAIWLFRQAGLGFKASTAVVAAALASIEFTQTRLPGRVAEITDPLLAGILALVLWLLETHEAGLKSRLG